MFCEDLLIIWLLCGLDYLLLETLEEFAPLIFIPWLLAVKLPLSDLLRRLDYAGSIRELKLMSYWAEALLFTRANWDMLEY